MLTRAAFEAFLIFHHVFYTPTTDEDKDYIYWAYILAGLKDRQAFPIDTDKQKIIIANDRNAIEELSGKLCSNAKFRGLNDKQKEKVLKGDWRLKSWREIAEDVELNKILASGMYHHLCGYAHSSSLSVRQTKIAFEKHEEELLIETSVSVVNILVANMILEYCELFGKSKEVLNQNQDGMNLIYLWSQIGHG